MKRHVASMRSVVLPLEARVLMAASSLDTTFSGDGKAVVDFFGAADAATDVAVQSDGKMLLAGRAEVPAPTANAARQYDVVLARLNADGTLDASFGRGGADGDGKVTPGTLTDTGTGRTMTLAGGPLVNARLLLQPDGKILLLAARGDDLGLGIALLRFSPDGTLDKTFGEGDGIAIADFADDDPVNFFNGVVATALAAGPDGRIVVVAGVTSFRSAAIGVAKFLPDGRRDNSFAPNETNNARRNDIFLFQSEQDSTSWPTDVAVTPNNDIIVGGIYGITYGDDAYADFALLRIAPGGELKARAVKLADPATQPGHFGYADSEALALLPDGDVLLGGSVYDPAGAGSDFALVRVNADFSKDTAFGGGDGVATSRFGSPALINDLTVLPDGKAIAAGYAGNAFALARFNADGSADTTFDAADASPDGRKTTAFSGGAARAAAVAIAPDGKIVAAGFAGGTADGPTAASDMAVARYKGDAVTPPPPPSGGALTYQAEQGTLSGAIVSRANAGYTGSGYVDFIASLGGTLDLEVEVPATGRYRIDARFANGGSRSRSLDVYVDGGSPKASIGFEPTGSWSNWRTTNVDAHAGPTVTLSAGRHTIRMRTVGQNGPNIDLVTLTPVSSTPRYEAEEAKLVGAVVSAANAGFTGRGYADFVNNSGDSVEWTIDVPTVGSYALDFRYANGGSSARPLEFWLDGVRGTTLNFGPTGGWTSWATQTIDFGNSLISAGTHTVKLVATGRSGANIDSLTLRAL